MFREECQGFAYESYCVVAFVVVFELYEYVDNRLGYGFFGLVCLVVTRLLFRDGIQLNGLPASPTDLIDTYLPFHPAGQPFHRFHPASSTI